MGISGLIPFLEKASRPVNVRDLRGTSVAVDSYCWLHKGVFACAEKLIIMVFDGNHLPAKAETERRRREARRESKKLAKEYLRMNDIEKARSHMRRAIDVTHEMALRLIKACRERGVECIVAPYEADAQMAWLNKKGLAEYIITEDSDLTLFGALKVLFKLDLQGSALLVESSKLHLAMDCKPEKYTFDKFRRMCILSGCDYLDSLPGIGLKKALKFMMITEEDDMTRALKKLPQYLKMKQLDVTDEYIEEFLKAEATFKHMYIYNPLKRRMERLHELEEFGTEEKYCSNAGTLLEDKEKAFQLALGNLNPFTLEKLHDWHPDKEDWSNTSKKRVNTGNHKSIWGMTATNTECKDNKCDKKQIAMLPFKKIEYKHLAETEIQERLANENSKLEEAEVFSMYSFRSGVQSKRKREPSTESEEEEEETKTIPPITPSKSHNPFAIINSNGKDKPKSPVCANKSLLKLLSPNKNSAETNNNNNKVKVDIRSRFFSQNIKQAVKKPFAARDLTQQMTQIEEKSQKSLAIQSSLYIDMSPQSAKCTEKLETTETTKTQEINNITNSQNLENISENKSSESHLSVKEEIVEILSDVEEEENISSKLTTVSKLQTNISSSQQSQKSVSSLTSSQRSIGLSKPKKAQKSGKNLKELSSDSKQSTLSMFGFQKRPTLKKM
ncbi:exonuclease tos isoform X2 [Musca autumnalis]|uniref:exonuclease tos isoform X2 n=1 Tax=Musca autumnalis TaxID=221902 RepID=UPI003CF7B5ED